MNIITFPNDEILLFSGSEDNKLYVWNVEDGSEYRTISFDNEKSNDRVMNCLSLSSSLNLLATSSFSNNDMINKIDILELFK